MAECPAFSLDCNLHKIHQKKEATTVTFGCGVSFNIAKTAKTTTSFSPNPRKRIASLWLRKTSSILHKRHGSVRRYVGKKRELLRCSAENIRHPGNAGPGCRRRKEPGDRG